MNHWSEKYLNHPYKWRSRDPEEGTDCLTLVELVLLQEKNYKIDEGGPVDQNWADATPSRLIDNAIQKGAIIEDIKNLQEFDVVFFKLGGVVRHLGIMIDGYGRFLHQLIDRTSRIDTITKRHWRDAFHSGVRANFG